MVLTTVVASANPFSDVPFSHWAHELKQAAAKGILQVIPMVTFKGKQTGPAMLSHGYRLKWLLTLTDARIWHSAPTS
jgi:hypothetical protein